ncbi:DeoR family transcriptional regulator [Dactylosporangium siamense]|uniref:DeoR family transcriptional regulator n=1 Tax=Dactylosporangium siamense TaxID=685454 RepID=A0A919U940_9ACTN|nr:DeoR family transcriptional regulator [Dactylosporangium siamense]GIG43390.1 DeoR family transcriptional regulator [Dactylosporangium siamense]
MLTDLRRAQILADARAQGGVSLRELSHRFEVSIPTIRRDLSALADQGLVQRVHGGAVVVRARAERGPVRMRTAVTHAPVPAAGGAAAPPAGEVFVARPVLAPEEAAALVMPGMAVGIAGGWAAVRLAELIDGVADLTVVTPVVAVAAAIRNPATVVVLVGGVRTPSGSHAGPLTQATLAALNLDLAAVERSDPATTGDALAAQTDLALVQRATAAVFVQGATGSRPRSG